MSLEHSPARDGVAAYTIKKFCEAHSISQSFYFKLKSLGLAPREMRLGTRVLITQEAAADWRRAREADHTTDSTPDRLTLSEKAAR